MNQASEAVSTREIDNLITYETVKLFGMERYESDKFDELQETLRDETLSFRMSLNALNGGQTFIQVTGTSLALLLPAKGASRGLVTPGDL